MFMAYNLIDNNLLKNAMVIIAKVCNVLYNKKANVKDDRYKCIYEFILNKQSEMAPMNVGPSKSSEYKKGTFT